jgi:preprotein translocase subunit YajC
MATFLILFQGGLGGLAGILPIVLIMGVFYVLLIRPQQKRQKQLQETISTLKLGDRVITNGGIARPIALIWSP